MTKLNESDLGYKLGLISFTRPSTVLRNTRYLHTIDPRSLGTVTAVLAGGALGTPLRWWEQVRHRHAIDRVEIDQPPIFIIGHWRSGTTHLHNLMSQDDRFGCVRMAQALSPDCSISTRRWLPALFDRVFPKKRPMDNMEWPMDAPQEEEIPLAKTTPYSWYLQFLFPQAAIERFRQAVLFEGVPDRVRAEVAEKYLRILKVATLHDGGRRLLLKNPVNTARIGLLLELFPDAKFVAIHRSPYEVFPSAVNLHRKILGLTAFQRWDASLVEQNVLEMYELVMDRYLAERSLIPPDNLVEVAYDDLDARPLEVLSTIYDRLALGGWPEARPAIEAYVESQAGYRKNGFQISDRAAELVEDRWGRFFAPLGYERRPPWTPGDDHDHQDQPGQNGHVQNGAAPTGRDLALAPAEPDLGRLPSR